MTKTTDASRTKLERLGRKDLGPIRIQVTIGTLRVPDWHLRRSRVPERGSSLISAANRLDRRLNPATIPDGADVSAWEDISFEPVAISAVQGPRILAEWLSLIRSPHSHVLKVRGLPPRPFALLIFQPGHEHYTQELFCTLALAFAQEVRSQGFDGFYWLNCHGHATERVGKLSCEQVLWPQYRGHQHAVYLVKAQAGR